MKILKTSALAAVLALASFSANATQTYSATATLDIEVSMAQVITASLANSTMTFANLVAGDSIAATQVLTIDADLARGDGSATRSLTCDIAGAGSGVTHTASLEDAADNEIVALEFSLATCTDGANTLTVTSGVNTISAAHADNSENYTIEGIDIVVSYVADTISTYS